MTGSVVRVELPIRAPSRILSDFRTIGELKKAFPSLDFVKYIYRDPKDQQLKGANPPDNLPIVENAYITVSGNIGDIVSFTKEVTGE